MAPRFDHSKITVIYVLGGPGAGKTRLLVLDVRLTTSAGKGTQCGRLVEDFQFCHLSGESKSHLLSRCYILAISSWGPSPYRAAS